MRQVEIFWHAPVDWEAAAKSNTGPHIGVYQICRTWSTNDRLLYIGLVKSERRSFYIRMNEHRKAWVNERRGFITYRFGDIQPYKGVAYTPALFEEVEGALILKLQPPHNIKKRVSFTIRQELLIICSGDRGFAPKKIDTSQEFC